MDSKSIRNEDGYWINTELFRESAKHFQKHGTYIDAPKDSNDYLEFWQRELDRCTNGYSVAGARITGDHYAYLNYSPIKRTTTTKGKSARKGEDFPDFYDGDYNYFHTVEIARDGILEEDLVKLHLDYKPLKLDGGYHLAVAKARRKGYSFKNAAMCMNRYNTRRNYKIMIGAFGWEYLFPDGPLSMLLRYRNFYDEHTAWKKKRDKLNKSTHFRASYLEDDVEKGYLSEIQGISFYNNEHAARGKSPDLFLFEEGGAFDNLLDTLAVTRPAMEDGVYVTGQIIVFGTGGAMDKGTLGLHELFYNPEPYGFLPFENIWEEGAEGTSCSYFVPGYQNQPGFIDEQGNSLEDAARRNETATRKAIINMANGANILAKRMQEYPLTPSEAFLNSAVNDFPIEALQRQRNLIASRGLFEKKGQACYITKSEGSIKVTPDLNGTLRPITEFPLSTQDQQGALVIYEHPVPNAPKGLYKIGYDPYVQEQSTGPSLGPIIVYKGTNFISPTRDLIVAEFTGRPSHPDDCHRIAEYLAEYYNTTIMHENMVKDVESYFKRRNKLHLLSPQADAVIAANIKDSKVNRKYGIHMNTQIKDAIEKYIKAWLLEEREEDEDGKQWTNIDFIFSPAILDELIKFDRNRGNYDRIMALGMVMVQIQNDAPGHIYDNTNHEARLKEFKDLVRNKYGRA